MMNERILNLLSLCMQAKEHGHDVFFYYSPHTAMVDVRGYKGGWNGATLPDFEMHIYADGSVDDAAETGAKFELMEAYLKGLVEE